MGFGPGRASAWAIGTRCRRGLKRQGSQVEKLVRVKPGCVRDAERQTRQICIYQNRDSVLQTENTYSSIVLIGANFTIKPGDTEQTTPPILGQTIRLRTKKLQKQHTTRPAEQYPSTRHRTQAGHGMEGITPSIRYTTVPLNRLFAENLVRIGS